MFWNPFEELERMHEEMDRIFNHIYRGNSNLLEDKREFGKLAKLGEGYRRPVTDIRETETGIIADIELPGVDKKDIQLNVLDDSIEVKVEKHDKQEIKEKGISGWKSNFSSFYRKIPLPTEVEADKAKARYRNGILSLELPKAKEIEDKRKRINIE